MANDPNQANILGRELAMLREEYPEAELEKRDEVYFLVVPRFRLPQDCWNKETCDLFLGVPDNWPVAEVRHVYIEPDLLLSNGDGLYTWLCRNPMVSTVVYLDGWLHFAIDTYVSLRRHVPGPELPEATTLLNALEVVRSMLDPSDLICHVEMYAQALRLAQSQLERVRKGLGSRFLELELLSLAARARYTALGLEEQAQLSSLWRSSRKGVKKGGKRVRRRP